MLNGFPHTHKHTRSYAQTYSFYLGDLGMGATAISRGGMHPPSALSQLQCKMGIPSASTLLPEGALLVLNTPTAFEPGVSFQAHAAAVAQCSALVQVGCPDRDRTAETHISY